LAAALIGASASAQTPGAPALRRGLNLSDWFTDSQRDPLVARDFQRLKEAGLDNVRIPINPELLGFSLFDAQEGRVLFDFTNLDAAVNLARDNGLATILDIQVSDSLLTQIQQDPRGEGGFVSLWAHLADHYKLYSSAQLAFEILGEPRFFADPEQYRALVSDVVAAIRKATPSATIIVDVPKSASLDGFEGFEPFDDPHLVYAFYFYEPYLFTHQGLRAPASRGFALRNFHDLPYPSSLVDPKANYAPTAPDPMEARKELSDYTGANWNAAKIAARIRVAAEWAKAKRQRVICAEFGVVRKSATPDARYRWIEDTRGALEANGIGWDLFDYADLFGVAELDGETIVEPSDGSIHLADPGEGSREIEDAAREALFK
jgi:endoglucanase